MGWRAWGREVGAGRLSLMPGVFLTFRITCQGDYPERVTVLFPLAVILSMLLDHVCINFTQKS